MKIVSNDKLIKRNASIAKITFFASLIVFGIGLVVSFQNPDDPRLLSYTMGALILGFTFSQVSIYYQNRFGKRPRPDEVLTASLKGLDDKFTLYHYASPIPHLLVGPSGVWGLLPYAQGGSIIFEKDRWKQKGGSFMLKLFGGEGLGRPDLEASGYMKDIQTSIQKGLPENELPPIRMALVFTNPKVQIDAADAPIPTIPAKKIKELVRKYSKADAVPDLELAAINKYMDERYQPKK